MQPRDPSPSAGDLRELPRVPLRGEGSCPARKGQPSTGLCPGRGEGKDSGWGPDPPPPPKALGEACLRTYCIAQGTLLSALWGPKWKGNPRRGAVCIRVLIHFAVQRGPDPSSKATLWVKAQHEGALPPPCIVRKDSRGQRGSLPQTRRGLTPRGSLECNPEIPRLLPGTLGNFPGCL